MSRVSWRPCWICIRKGKSYGIAEKINGWKDILEIFRTPPDEPVPFLLVFIRNRRELEDSKPFIRRNIDPGGLIWIAYPKKTSRKYKSDVSRDDFWDGSKDLGLEPVRQIALEDDWSALRFRPGKDFKRKR